MEEIGDDLSKVEVPKDNSPAIPPVPAPKPPFWPSFFHQFLPLIIIMLGVTVLVLVVVSYYAYPKIANKSQTTPPTALKPTPTPNPTANWKTYTGNGISFMYPPELGDPNNGQVPYPSINSGPVYFQFPNSSKTNISINPYPYSSIGTDFSKAVISSISSKNISSYFNNKNTYYAKILTVNGKDVLAVIETMCGGGGGCNLYLFYYTLVDSGNLNQPAILVYSSPDFPGGLFETYKNVIGKEEATRDFRSSSDDTNTMSDVKKIVDYMISNNDINKKYPQFLSTFKFTSPAGGANSSADKNCSQDSDCALTNYDPCPNNKCNNYAGSDWVSVNANSLTASLTPTACTLIYPVCARTLEQSNAQYSAKCVNSVCQKVKN